MKKDNAQVGFALHAVKTEQFAILEDNYSPKKETGLSTEFQFKLDPENKQIGVFIAFELLQGKKVFLKIVVSCHFKIEEKSWATFIHENKLVVPKGFMAHLAMITTGTARGVLVAKTEATPFSKFIVPTINVDEMIKEDATFDMKVEPGS